MTVVVHAVNYIPTPEVVFVNGMLPPLICRLCDKPIMDNNYITMPWGSDFEGDSIHNACVHKHFDPVVAKKVANMTIEREKENGKPEK